MKTFADLCSQLVPDYRFPPIPINGITCDSRKVKPGYIFACLPGYTTSGEYYLEEALINGASVVICNNPINTQVPFFVFPEIRKVYAHLCSAFYNHPSKSLNITAVTGTNGKTTTVLFLENIFKNWNANTSYITTVWVNTGSSLADGEMTTPPAEDLQRILADMVNNQVTECIIEASSHALDQERLGGCQIQTAVFTNLTRDHLDYHGDMENYFYSKLKLFKARKGVGVINADDYWSSLIPDKLPGEYINFGLGVQHKAATVQGEILELNKNGTRLKIYYPGGNMNISLKIPGICNVYNALAAVTTALIRGVPSEFIIGALENIRNLPGRFQKIEAGQPFEVYVDFAHNPSGLKESLSALREKNGRTILVFGCKGQDHDLEKRRMMGSIASSLADYIIITSDNIYEDDPGLIASEIASGIELIIPKVSYEVILDRRAAIKRALTLASPVDTVIIAGKGHEKDQIIGQEKVPFDDREIAFALLKELSGTNSVLINNLGY